MRYVCLLIIAALFMVTPVYLLDAYVMPELLSLQSFYSQADTRATELVATH
jgi:hypothetical protein